MSPFNNPMTPYQRPLRSVRKDATGRAARFEAPRATSLAGVTAFAPFRPPSALERAIPGRW